MTKAQKLTAIDLIDAANLVIACQRGIIACAHNRPFTGPLVPKFDSPAEAHEWERGWLHAEKTLKSVD